MNILSILLLLLALAFLLWISWNVLEIIYHAVMMVVYAFGYVALTLWDVLSFIVRWTLVKPVSGITALLRH